MNVCPYVLYPKDAKSTSLITLERCPKVSQSVRFFDIFFFSLLLSKWHLYSFHSVISDCNFRHLGEVHASCRPLRVGIHLVAFAARSNIWLLEPKEVLQTSDDNCERCFCSVGPAAQVEKSSLLGICRANCEAATLIPKLSSCGQEEHWHQPVYWISSPAD